ncbi:MAG: hypothetical protein JSW73_05385 [Candidatus Woesearchaeota archaeon]|nr:MAG: hypothetical protein JSW73_05385 [Candidatus Woesearchaeota archaeon]
MAKGQGSEEHKEHHKETHKRHKSKISRKKIILLLSGLIIGAIFGYIASVTTPGIGGSSVKCDASVGEEAQAYVVDNFLAIQGLDAELGAVEKVGTICKVDLSITRNGTMLQETEVYMTPDTDYLILGQVLPTSEEVEQPEPIEQLEQPETASCESLKKEDSPVLDAFVVSYCPFGVQMQRILAEIVKEIPELDENIKTRYMGSIVNGEVTAMHGEKEAQENLRQICIREEQSDKFWDYINCFIKEGEVESCLDEAEIDTDMLDTCMTGEKGLEYAQEDFDLTKQYSVTGSPTLILNGERVREFDFGGRTAEAVKTVLCCGFTSKPEVCSTELATEQAARSFSATYSGSSGSSSSGGSC